MKSLLERVTARPLNFIGLIIAVIAIVIILWWLLSPSAPQDTAGPTPSIIANQKIITPTKQSEAASAPASTTVATTNHDSTVETPASSPVPSTQQASLVPAANTDLPKDTTTAAEELDRLKDEESRLKERKKELAKQLAISNKLLALKEQQLKELGQINP